MRNALLFSNRWVLSSSPKNKDESRLLYDMGRETANIHFGSPKAIAHVERDLTSRRSHWLHRAAKNHVQATLKDWDNWQQS